MKPLCFVLMPFGRKQDTTGRMVDFDAVYREIIAPAVTAADLDPIRADEEQVGGTIHKPMFERLMLCEFAVADVTGANPNVYYELGVRHAIRPRSTVILFAQGTVLPFDIALLRGVAYQTDASGNPTAPEQHIGTIATYLRSARQDHHIDSPVFQFVDYAQPLEVDHAKTDLFRKQVDYSREYKTKLGAARKEGLDAIRAVAADPALENMADVEAGIVIDLFLSYRAVKAHQDMVDLYARMPQPLQRTRMIREQLAFALNRLGRSEDAEHMLTEIIAKLGPSSETNALLGRVYKDRWEAALKEGDEFTAAGLLDRAVEAYRTGFEADWRDPYPGINAVTLMELQDPPNPLQADLLPVVRYAALQRCQGKADYWDHATLIELAVLARNNEEARKQTGKALALIREVWEPETTARNLRLIRETRERRGEDVAWLAQIETGLKRAQERFAAPKTVAATS
jgi:tetratricopeptide (TPR) repeat protein